MNIFGVVFVVLLVLKLTALITISWWAVFSPMLIAFVFGFIIGVIKAILKQ